jgi:phosphatidylinositol-3-phosphatase
MKEALGRPFRRAVAAAATLTGRRFGMLVASSLVATSVIVASAITNPANDGPLAALLGRSLASSTTPPSSPATPVAESSSAASSPTPSTHGAVKASSGAPASTAAIDTPEEEEGSEVEETEEEPGTSTTPTTPTATAGRIKHVFVISLASPGYEAAFGPASQMPYLAGTLRPQGELLSGYSLLGSTGLPNDIAAVSGQPPNASTETNCSTNAEFPPKTAPNKSGVITASGCLYPVEALTIADQLSSGGFQWKAYMEDMAGTAGKPENCVHPSSGSAESPAQGGYAARQNPFVYFNSLLELGACASSDVPLTELGTDLGTISSTPNYSFIAPSLCDAGVPGECSTGSPSGASSADAFLSEWVPQILASPAYQKDGLLMITFDEAPPSPTTPPKVGTLLLSPFVTHNTTDASPYNPYSLLRSTEDLFGLTHLGAAEGSTVSSFAPALLGETGGD